MSQAETPCGFLILDKPAGLTSHDCVARARRLLGTRRIGHGGTLDPAVTGVLPLAVGPATRLLPYLDGTKAYEGAIQLGLLTSSDDLHGEVLQQSPWPQLSLQELEQHLESFRGTLKQRRAPRRNDEGSCGSCPIGKATRWRSRPMAPSGCA